MAILTYSASGKVVRHRVPILLNLMMNCSMDSSGFCFNRAKSTPSKVAIPPYLSFRDKVSYKDLFCALLGGSTLGCSNRGSSTLGGSILGCLNLGGSTLGGSILGCSILGCLNRGGSTLGGSTPSGSATVYSTQGCSILGVSIMGILGLVLLGLSSEPITGLIGYPIGISTFVATTSI
uniref:Uncharacterized protein n=1 Tax=Fagus sylvatica TaxID=28930 RepID=A0A2N9ELJ2_FAGSY